MPSVIIDMSSSMSVFADKRDPLGSHFRWDSIKKFVYLACTYSNSVYNFDIFSKVTNVSIDSSATVFVNRLYTFAPKMCVVLPDFTECVIPTNVGITDVARARITELIIEMKHSVYIGDALRFLLSSFRTIPGWAKCDTYTVERNVTCIPAYEIIYKCQEQSVTNLINFENTSSHHNYAHSFILLERSIMTTRFFAIAIVWVINFFFSTVSDDSILKIFKVAFICRSFTDFVIVIFLYLSARRSSSAKAFNDIFIVGSDHSLMSAARHIAYMYGIGFLGLHDFSSMSVFTMVDNAVILYSALFTVTALVRSWMIRVMYLEMASCVKLNKPRGPHYLIFAILPLCTEFFPAHKLYIFYLYFNIVLSTSAYLILLTLTLAKLLHSEFSSVKHIYLVGMLCFIGFASSLFSATCVPSHPNAKGIAKGLDIMNYYLGAFKSALIMWVYGVQRFSTDIHFWLGFKPTRYWTICWFCLPIILLGCLARKIYLMIKGDASELVGAIVWIISIVLVVVFFQIKTIAKFLLQNNIVNVMSANKRYGPPDAEDRKRRRNFDETVQLRQCRHNCNPFDEMIDCNHLPLARTSSGNMLFDEDSLTNIYTARPTVTRLRAPSAAIDIT